MMRTMQSPLKPQWGKVGLKIPSKPKTSWDICVCWILDWLSNSVQSLFQPVCSLARRPALS